MRCPIDGTELKIIERQGVAIDLCPRCRGVWLDRGELDKIIEAAYAVPPSAGPTAPPNQDPPSVGVWADSIPQAPASQAAPPQAAPQPQPGQAQQQQAPGLPDLSHLTPMLPALGGLLAGLAAGSQGQRRSGKRKHRGWLEEIFDIDLS